MQWAQQFARPESKATREYVRNGTPRATLILVTTLLAVLAGSGCGGPGNVRFDRDHCYINGEAAGLTQVEEREALVQHRIAVRQPWLVVITVVVVLLAGIGYIEKLVLLLSAGRDNKGLGERLRASAERYRAHRLRYFAMVGGSVGLLVTAGILYIYVDADKRTSERALAALQFCHLALRTSEETTALDEQRQNLASIHRTAGEIRQLIDKLPPAEQVKAQEIIGHMDDAVGRERRLITDQLQRSEDTAESIREGTLSIEKSLTTLQGSVSGLTDLPAHVKAVSDTLHTAEERQVALQQTVAALTDALQAVQSKVNSLASRPPPSCPACICSERPSVASAKTGNREAQPSASTVHEADDTTSDRDVAKPPASE